MPKLKKTRLYHRLWDALSRPRNKFSVLTLIFVFFTGMIFLVGFSTAMDSTNTLEFCISCHEMRDTVFKEYQESIHYNNSSGMRATCADCHVPKDWLNKMTAKIRAAKDVYGTVMGVIDTSEKFESKRHEMAVNVWRRMKTTDSLECRNCHNSDAMSEEAQSEKAWRRHQKGIKEGQTCIDCHFGIVHQEPEGPGPQELDLAIDTDIAQINKQ